MSHGAPGRLLLRRPSEHGALLLRPIDSPAVTGTRVLKVLTAVLTLTAF